MSCGYTKREIKQEQEANQFALCLLMPEEMFLSKWSEVRKRFNEEEKVAEELAKIFVVPLSACYARMFQLGSKFLTNEYPQKH